MRMKSVHKMAIAGGAAGLLLLAGCTTSGSDDTSESPSAATSESASGGDSQHSGATHDGQISFALAEEGGSGQEGLAIAYPSGDNLTVMTVAMQGALLKRSIA